MYNLTPIYLCNRFNVLTAMSKSSQVFRIVMSIRMLVTDIFISDKRVIWFSVTCTSVEILGSEATARTFLKTSVNFTNRHVCMSQKTRTFVLYFFAKILTLDQKWRCHRSKCKKKYLKHYLYPITPKTEHTVTFIVSIRTSVQLSSCLKIKLVFCFQMVHKNFMLYLFHSLSQY